MNKKLLILLFSAFSTFSYSQSRIQNNFFSVNRDTLILNINEKGEITTKSKAVYYRKAKLDTNVFIYSGRLSDYFIDNQKAYECYYIHKKLNGSVKSFYPTGKLKYCGYFKNSAKDSIWTFYYDNGNIEKVIHFYDNVPYLKEFYRKNGKMVFNDGSGKFKSTIRYSKEPLDCTISGKILNGKMEGAWHWQGEYAQGIEYFKDGEYIKTEDYGLNDGFNNPRIISLTGFDPHENVAIFDFIAIPQEDNKSDMNLTGIPLTFKSKYIATSVSFNSSDSNNIPITYKGSPNLRDSFVNDLSNHLLTENNKNQIKDFWCFIQFTIDENNIIENINTYSNKNEISKTIDNFLLDNVEFKAPIINNKTVKCNIYLNVFYMNNTLYIPDYRYNNSTLNLFDLK